jgi:hypothetical protein
MCSRFAIHANAIVVSRRRRKAIFTFSGRPCGLFQIGLLPADALHFPLNQSLGFLLG